ncbi:hypothetical protein, partial [Bradyrhizobium sp. NBAIM20]
CVSAPGSDAKSKDVGSKTSTSPYDLSEVCLTDQGKPASKGSVYKGKTCSSPEIISFQHKNILEWR